jgi:hypothetical protein
MQRGDSPVGYDDRGFKLIYATLDIKKRTKISLLATLGLRAPDPETAWLVMMFALAQLRFRRLRLVLGIAALAVSVWGYAQIDRFCSSAPLSLLNRARVPGIALDPSTSCPGQRANRSGPRNTLTRVFGASIRDVVIVLGR